MKQGYLRLLLFLGGCVFAAVAAYVLLSSEEARKRDVLFIEGVPIVQAPFKQQESLSEYPDGAPPTAHEVEEFKEDEGFLSSLTERLFGEDDGVPKEPYIALVIDDFGYSRKMAVEYARLEVPMTWAIIPFLRFSSFAAERAKESGIPYIIHLPMGAREDARWAAGKPVDLVDSGMSREDISSFLLRVAESLPDAVGLNNHRGSRATSDEPLMEFFMNVLREFPFFFLDSRTSSSSAAYRTAVAKGVPALYNSIFLDHEQSKEFMEAQFQRGLAIAKKRGWVVMIAHTRNTTLEFLREIGEAPFEEGTFVTLPDLVRFLVLQ